MEDYVDDILAKSYTREGHLEILAKIFDRLEKFKVRLNPKKCAFGVTSAKLLGYIVSTKGIEVDPAKVQTIMEMPPPKNISTLRSLQGRLQSIKRFISQLADRCHPFNHLLHKNVPFKWDEQCESTFNQIKHYLMTPPILVPPSEDKPLLLYIATTDISLGALLAQEDKEGKEQAIYYISRTLNGHEVNYTFIEKSCLAVIFATQKL